jgi:serine/threonine protein kinase/Tfp pilus assembly protein PilF
MNGENGNRDAQTITPPLGVSSSDDSRVVAALEEYLSLLKTGRRPNREEFLASKPEIASALAECLDGLEFVQSAAPELSPQEVAASRQEVIPPTTRLGDFRVVREIGRGGMGVVYEAEQLSLGRKVALKVLPFAASIDPRQRQRFQLEAQAAAHLHHTHIVPIFAVGSDQGINYYAMQFIDGRTLASLIQELKLWAEKPESKPSAKGGDDFSLVEGLLAGRLSEDSPKPSDAPSTVPHVASKDPSTILPSLSEGGSAPSSSSHRSRAFFRVVARLGVQAAEALEHAHVLGVLHRDVKPGNLMIDFRGELWVTDFGLARFQDDIGLTRTGDVLGTLRYTSPEQAAGRHQVVDQRADIYSLGATLYELATLRPAFHAKDRAELLRQIAVEEPTPPRRLNPSIPRDLETIILKAMSKDPVSRYESAQELADDLNRFLDDKPIRARRPTVLEHAAKLARRHRAVVSTAAIVAVLTLSISAVALWKQNQQLVKANDDLQRVIRINSTTNDLADELVFEGMGKFNATNAAEVSAAHNFYRRALRLFQAWAEVTKDDPYYQSQAARNYFRIGFTKMLLGEKGADEGYQEAVRRYEAIVAKSPEDKKAKAGLAQLLNWYGAHLAYSRTLEEYLPIAHKALALEWSQANDDRANTQLLSMLISEQLGYADKLAAAKRIQEADQARRELHDRLSAWAAESSARSPEVQKGLKSAFTTLAKQLKARSRHEDADQALAEALKLPPEDPDMLNDYAWFLVSKPNIPARDAKQAIELARKGVERAPNPAAIWNTLGVAQVRAGDWKGSLESLAKSCQLNNGGDPNDWLFQAIDHWKLGDKAEAKRLYERSAEWIEQQPSIQNEAELRSFQTEAAAVLGLPAPKPKPKPESKPKARVAIPKTPRS